MWERHLAAICIQHDGSRLEAAPTENGNSMCSEYNSGGGVSCAFRHRIGPGHGRSKTSATVRIRFRDRWFYIAATDTHSKRALTFLRTLIGMRLADPGAAQRAPVLTVPVN